MLHSVEHFAIEMRNGLSQYFIIFDGAFARKIFWYDPIMCDVERLIFNCGMVFHGTSCQFLLLSPVKSPT